MPERRPSPICKVPSSGKAKVFLAITRSAVRSALFWLAPSPSSMNGAGRRGIARLLGRAARRRRHAQRCDQQIADAQARFSCSAGHLQATGNDSRHGAAPRRARRGKPRSAVRGRPASAAVGCGECPLPPSATARCRAAGRRGSRGDAVSWPSPRRIRRDFAYRPSARV